MSDKIRDALQAALLIAKQEWDFPGAHPHRAAVVRQMEEALAEELAPDPMQGVHDVLRATKAAAMEKLYGKRKSPFDPATWPTRDQIATTIWVKSRNYAPTPDELHCSVFGRECLDIAEAIRALTAKDASPLPSTGQKSPCTHALIIGLDGKWRCRTCGDASDMAIAQSTKSAGPQRCSICDETIPEERCDDCPLSSTEGK